MRIIKAVLIISFLVTIGIICRSKKNGNNDEKYSNPNDQETNNQQSNLHQHNVIITTFFTRPFHNIGDSEEFHLRLEYEFEDNSLLSKFRIISLEVSSSQNIKQELIGNWTESIEYDINHEFSYSYHGKVEPYPKFILYRDVNFDGYYDINIFNGFQDVQFEYAPAFYAVFIYQSETQKFQFNEMFSLPISHLESENKNIHTCLIPYRKSRDRNKFIVYHLFENGELAPIYAASSSTIDDGEGTNVCDEVYWKNNKIFYSHRKFAPTFTPFVDIENYQKKKMPQKKIDKILQMPFDYSCDFDD